MARTMTATKPKPKPAPTAVTTGGVPGGLQALRNLLDMYGRPASEMSLKERAEAITGYELKQRIEALVRGITGQKINHIYAGSGAATAPGMMLLPRIAGTMLFSPREVKIILGYTAHELAHQLHTDFGLVASIFEDLEKPTTREQQVKEFWNGIEDYRIERESRKRYPGFPGLINETRDHTARRFVEQVDAGLIPEAGLANAYRIGSVALTWIGARLNNYATQAPAEALMRVPDPLRSWLESWDTEMAATVTCEDARDLAIRILDEIDRMRANPPKEEEEDEPGQEGDEGEKGPCDKKGGSDQDNPSNDPSQGANGDETSDSESGEGGKPKDSGQADSDRSADGDDGKPASGDGKEGGAGDDDGDPKNGAGGASDNRESDDEGADQADRSGSGGEPDERPDGDGGEDAEGEGSQGDSEADDGKGVGSGGDDTDQDKGESAGDGQSESGEQGGPDAGAGDDGQSSQADGDKDGSTDAGAGGQSSEGDPGPDKGSANSGTDQGGQSDGADAGDDASGGTDGTGEKDGDPVKNDGDREEGDADGEKSDGEGEKEEGSSRPTPPPAGGSAGSGSGQDAGDPSSGAMPKDAGEGGEAGADGAGPSKPMPQSKPERRDIHVPEGDQNEKAEEADLAIDELIEAINEACQGMAEAETPDIHDPKRVAASDEDNEDIDDFDGEDGQGVEQHRVKRTGTEKYTMLRQQLSSAAARTAGVVRRMLQSRNRTRTRSGLEDGHLDFSRLVPMAMGASDVYRQTRSTPQINTALSLLLDNSGSMSGHPLRLCQETAIVLDMSVQGTPTALEILGFTSGSGGTRIYQYRTFEQKGVSSAASLGNMDSVELGGTPVGTPIMEAWRRLRQRKEPRRIMIVVSDGGAQDPVEALAAARIVEMQGGTIVGIAIGAEQYMKQWCEKVVPISNVDELPQALAQIVQEHLSR